MTMVEVVYARRCIIVDVPISIVYENEEIKCRSFKGKVGIMDPSLAPYV